MQSPQEPLPNSYGIAQLDDGQYYPVHQSFFEEEHGHCMASFGCLFWECEAASGIPPARGPRHMRGLVSFPTHEQAVDYWQRYREELHLTITWQQLTARSELYPERNAWYLEAIQAMTGNQVHVRQIAGTAYAFVELPEGSFSDMGAESIDEAIARLYECVYQICSQGHTMLSPAS